MTKLLLLPVLLASLVVPAAPSVRVEPAEQVAGRSVRFWARGFPARQPGVVQIAGIQARSFRTGPAGGFAGWVRVPASAPVGETTFRVTVAEVSVTTGFRVLAAPDPVRPGPSNTGFRVPVSELTEVGSPGRCVFASELGVPAGGTLSKVRVRGILALDRPNVRVVDSWLEEGVRVILGCGIGGAGVGAVIEHNRIGPPAGRTLPPGTNAIGDGGFAARWNDIYGFEDGCRCNGNVVFEHNWVHDLLAGPDAHNDAVQLTDNGDPAAGWGGPTYIRFNALENRFTQTGAVTLGADTGPVRWPVIIEGNWLSGGGYTLYGGWSADPAMDPVDVRIIGNVWERTFFPCSGAYGPVIYLPRVHTWGPGNRWADGSPMVPSPNAC